MALSPGDRIVRQKRVIDTLESQLSRDIRLTLSGFGIPIPGTYNGLDDLVEKAISGYDDDGVLLRLDEFLHPETDHGRESPMDDLLQDEDNTPFSNDEQQVISQAISELKRQAQETYDLPPEQLQLLEAKLDYAADAVKRSRRRDWLNITYGAIASSFAGGVLTPDVVQKVLFGVAAGVGHLFGAPLAQLPPG
jgi:hypothetical protein